MSDFVSDFWSYFVGVAVILSILACAWLLWIAGRNVSSTPQTVDENGHAQVGTTGHVWDEDLEELNNPLPRWWAWLFVVTMIFGLAYLAIYPGLGSAPGQAQWTAIKQYEAEKRAAEVMAAPLYAKFANLTPEQLAGRADAMAVGERLFLNNCAQCHGSDARGSKGFPNLADQDWLYGGSPDKIVESITKGRQGTMPSMAAAIGSTADISNVANYVLSLSHVGGGSIKAILGRDKFAVCAACHGADGTGNQTLGSPNLTDSVWLFGYGEENIVAAINNGHASVMPAHESKLTAMQIRILAGYVWRLSNPTVMTAADATPAGR